MAAANAPGELVTFLGYEWHGNRRQYGDHNVFYLRDDGPLDASEALPDLCEHLRQREAIAIPHHTAYQLGERGKDWDFHDDQFSPLAEIFSSHGSSEGCNTPVAMTRNVGMGPRLSGGTIQDGLRRGYRLGIIAAGDNHYGFPGVWGNGLAAVYAQELPREALWDAFLNRRVYGVTGDRIKLQFSIDGHLMGECFKATGPVQIAAAVEGSEAVDRIELLRNGQVIHTTCHSGEWGAQADGPAARAKIRLECGWGPQRGKGFEVGDKEWKGCVEVLDGELISVEPCFTDFGQRVDALSRRECRWTLRTKQQAGAAFHALGRDKRSFQSLIFEVRMPPKGRMRVHVDGQKVSFTLAEAFRRTHLLAASEEAQRLVQETFHLSPEEVENPDAYWHNTYKTKIHMAVPEKGYRAGCEVEELPPQSRSYYYVRVSQTNGQVAWSSPIWVEA